MARMDWAFTEDGDLGLSDPEVNEFGEVLYRHIDGSIDNDKGEDGKEVRDIGWVYDLEAEKQVILNRLRTDAPDWYHHPQMGGNLTDLIGEPNTRETGELGANYIMAALTYAELYNPSQLRVRAIPMSETEMVFMIDVVKLADEIVRLPLIFNLVSGLMDFYQPAKVTDEGE